MNENDISKILVVDHPNQVWCSDIKYAPLRRGFLYLLAVMDWYSRYVLCCRLSNSSHAAFLSSIALSRRTGLPTSNLAAG